MGGVGSGDLHTGLPWALGSPATRLFSPATRLFSPATRLFSPATRLFSPATRLFSPATRLFSPACVEPEIAQKIDYSHIPLPTHLVHLLILTSTQSYLIKTQPALSSEKESEHRILKGNNKQVTMPEWVLRVPPLVAGNLFGFL